MKLTFRWRPIAPLACALMTASCAASRPTSPVAPPRLALPEIAKTPCNLPVLPTDPTQADLDLAYLARGQAILVCDGARRLAVETLLAERALQDRWRAERDPR